MLALPKLSIVITVTDASHRVASVIDEASRALSHATLLDFIVVDDATDDTTQRELAALADADERVRLYRQPTAMGTDAALWQAAELALGEWIVTLDAYGRDDPHDVPEMLCDAQQYGLTLVEGIPLAPRCRWKRTACRIARSVGIELTDSIKCGLRLVRKDALSALPPIERLHRFLPLLIRRGGGRIGIYRVNPRYANEAPGMTFRQWPLRTLGDVRDWLGVYWLSRRWRPRRTLDRGRSRALAR